MALNAIKINKRQYGAKHKKIKHEPGNGETTLGVFVTQSKGTRDDSGKGEQDRDYHHDYAASEDNGISGSFCIGAKVESAFGRCSKDNEVNTPYDNNKNSEDKRNRPKMRQPFRGFHNKFFCKIKLTS